MESRPQTGRCGFGLIRACHRLKGHRPTAERCSIMGSGAHTCRHPATDIAVRHQSVESTAQRPPVEVCQRSRTPAARRLVSRRRFVNWGKRIGASELGQTNAGLFIPWPSIVLPEFRSRRMAQANAKNDCQTLDQTSIDERRCFNSRYSTSCFGRFWRIFRAAPIKPANSG